MSNSPNRVVGIYQPHFLSISMTFIYRQLIGVSDEFSPIVLASRLDNQELFPYPRVYERRISALERMYIRVVRKATGRLPNMPLSRRRFWRKVLIRRDVQFVHSHFGPSGIDILPVVKSLKRPLLVTFHGFDASRLLASQQYVVQLQRLFEYAHVIAVSKEMANRLIEVGAPPSRTFVHYIGAPVDDFSFVHRKPLDAKYVDKDAVVFLQVANFVEKKGHAYSLEAFRNFSDHYPRCKLILAGDGPLREQIERQSEELGVRNKVEFVGPVSKLQVFALMKNADVFLHHSVTAGDGDKEGIPTVLMEAMATGLVVFSTYHSGIPELISDGENGFLSAERDVAGYTEKLIWSLTHGSDIPEKAARTVARDFDQRKQNTTLKEIYRQVLKGSESAG